MTKPTQPAACATWKDSTVPESPAKSGATQFVVTKAALVPSMRRDPSVGDLVAVFQSGAYARTASPLGFLSHATPPEVLVRDGEAILIRRRGTDDDLLRDVPPLP